MYYYFFIDEKYKKYIHRYDTQTTHLPTYTTAYYYIYIYASI